MKSFWVANEIIGLKSLYINENNVLFLNSDRLIIIRYLDGITLYYKEREEE